MTRPARTRVGNYRVYYYIYFPRFGTALPESTWGSSVLYSHVLHIWSTNLHHIDDLNLMVT